MHRERWICQIHLLMLQWPPCSLNLSDEKRTAVRKNGLMI